MQICLVSQEYPPDTARGGIGTQTWNKARTLAALGHSVHVLSCLSPGAGGAGPGRGEGPEGITVHRMRPPGEDPAHPIPLYDPAAYMLGYTWQVLDHLNRLSRLHAFDLVNFPEYGAEGFAYQANRTPWNWIPVVVQLHGPLAMFTERIGWPERDSRFFRIGSFLEGESIRMADGLMASSANIADFAADAYGVERGSIDVVHCGIDCGVFRPPEPGDRPGGRPTVLFAGNVEASKGARTVFEAVLRLRDRHPDILLRFLGKGGDLVEQLRSRARREGVERHVEFCGFVKDRAALPDFYRDAWVMASPADHEVGVANVYVEAMACGCPVVAARTGGAPEAVRDGREGLLVPPRDVEATAAALDRILADPALARRLGEAGRQRALSYFATDQYIGRVLAAYHKAIERSRARLGQLAPERASGRS